MATQHRGKLILKRLLDALPGVAGIIRVTFLLTRMLPGDPAAYFAGMAADAASVEEVRRQLGLDKSLPEQFLRYVADLATGDWGRSVSTGYPVTEELLRRLPASLELTLFGLLFALAAALPLGVCAALKPGSWVDHLCRVVVTAGVSLPTFFVGLVLVYVFYYLLGWAPSPLGRLDLYTTPPAQITGFYVVDSLLAADLAALRASLAQLCLPAITLGLFVMAPLARMSRAALLGALQSDYVRTARAGGLSETAVLLRHAVPNAALPVMTTLGMVFSFMLGSNVLVEKVFAWPGIGSYAVEALIASDYAPVQGFVLVMAMLYVLMNLSIDLAYTLIDPRVTLGD